MALSRYERCPIVNLGTAYGTSTAHVTIKTAIQNGLLPYTTIILHERDRLDHVAGRYYGNGRYWWVIAAASDIGWALQVPPGTVINIPDLAVVSRLIG
jgi:hypothetical protein